MKFAKRPVEESVITEEKEIVEEKREVTNNNVQKVSHEAKVEEPVQTPVKNVVEKSIKKSEPVKSITPAEKAGGFRFVEESGFGYSEDTPEGEPQTAWGAYTRGEIDKITSDDKKKKKNKGNDDEVDDAYLKSEEGKIDIAVEELVHYFTSENPALLNQMERGVLTKEEFLDVVVDKIKEMRLDKEFSKKVYKSFQKYMWSYDRLDELIEDEDISDIKVLRYNCIRIKVKGKRKTSTVRFKDEKAYVRFVEKAAIKNKVSISDQNAVTNFTDTESNPRFIMRWNISTPFVNSISTPYIHIRKIDKHKVGFTTLIQRGMMSPDIARFLRYEATHSEGLIFTGKGASGKTTCMNAALDLIPLNNSGLVIQENEELFSDIHPDLMFQKTVLNKGEGKIQYTLQDLARNGLLVDLDYFVIGEIKGGEALYMLNASYTGHKCWCSVHGASSTEGINKLVDYIKYSSDYSREDALHMLTHLETVIFMKNYKVWEVSKIVGWDANKGDLIYKPIIREGRLVVRIDEKGAVID